MTLRSSAVVRASIAMMNMGIPEFYPVAASPVSPHATVRAVSGSDCRLAGL